MQRGFVNEWIDGYLLLSKERQHIDQRDSKTQILFMCISVLRSDIHDSKQKLSKCKQGIYTYELSLLGVLVSMTCEPNIHTYMYILMEGRMG